MYLYDGRHWLIVDGRLPMHCNLFIEKFLTIRIDTNLSKQMLNFTLTKRWAIPEKIQTGRGWGHTFMRKSLETLCLLLYLWKFHKKQSFNPEYSPKSCYSLWKFQSQKPRPIEIPHEFFFESPQEISLLF